MLSCVCCTCCAACRTALPRARTVGTRVAPGYAPDRRSYYTLTCSVFNFLLPGVLAVWPRLTALKLLASQSTQHGTSVCFHHRALRIPRPDSCDRWVNVTESSVEDPRPRDAQASRFMGAQPPLLALLRKEPPELLMA